MSSVTKYSRNRSLPASLMLLVVFISSFVLQGCGGGGGGAAPVVPVNEDASGLYKGAGTVNNGTALNDVRGFVHANRFMFFDEAEAVLYDGQITSITGNDVVATVSVYKNGVLVAPADVGVTGTVTGEAKMELTFAGTGYASGTLNLLFDLLYNRTVTYLKIASNGINPWQGDRHTSVTGSGRFSEITSSSADISGFTAGASSQCAYDNGLKNIPIVDKNIYLISFDVTQSFNCDHLGTGYTGFLALVDDNGAENTLLFAASNGTNSNFSVLTH